LGRKKPKVARSNNIATGKGETPQLNISEVGSEAAFELIDRDLNSAKFETIADAKKILAIRKKLHSLRFDVKTLLGGK
jgi:hypothetical protein